ncbi:MAG: phytanoyl-CoA dioxygenase family protein, partial [Armatimonadetes bacterium]|nr:phytanoyl-CoA dioxygenase family protein [Armatimonadota bacterium]
MELSRTEREALLRDGYVIVPGVVPRRMVDAALRAINHSLGEGMNEADVTRFRAQSYCPELQRTPTFTDLINRTPVFELAESVIGAGNVVPPGGAQIALRFPRPGDPPATISGHLDGMHTPTNGVPKGEIHNFTMLAVVLLSDLTGPWQGNFSVWPGTHHKYEAWFREHGPESLLDGMPQVDLPEPVQITGRPGDVVLTHYQICHTAAPNHSPHIRYASIYRLNAVNHEERKREAMTDIWMEWPGIRE